MTILHPQRRRQAAIAARSSFVVSALAFTVSVVGAISTDVLPAAAATAGTAQVIEPLVVGVGGGALLTEGDGTTEFSLSLPADAACTGDTANAGYALFGYMIAASADPNDLTFNSEGPNPITLGTPQANFQSPLYDTTHTPYASALTAPAVPATGPGLITNIPAFHLATLIDGSDLLPEGEYNIGIACWHTVTADNPTAVLDKFWNAVITVEIDPAVAGPAGVTWTAEVAPTATEVDLEADPEDEAEVGDEVTLTATVTPDEATGTITFRDDGTALGAAVNVEDGEASFETDDLDLGDHTLTADFTPAAAAVFAPSTSDELEYTILAQGAATTTSTTTGGSSTTSTTTAGGSTTTSTTSVTATTPTTRAGGPTTGVNASNLARTGFSFPIAVWGVLLVILGRMAVLLGRPPRVRRTG